MAVITNVEARTLPDFATSYNWRIRFDISPTGLEVPAQFNTLCKSATIPKREANPGSEIIVGRKFKRNIPAVEFTNGQITLTMFEPADNRMRNFCRNWRELNHENQTGVAVPTIAAYAQVSLFQQNRQQLDTYKYTLSNVWCVDYDYGTEFTDAEGNTLFDNFQIILSYDHLDEFDLT